MAPSIEVYRLVIFNSKGTGVPFQPVSAMHLKGTLSDLQKTQTHQSLVSRQQAGGRGLLERSSSPEPTAPVYLETLVKRMSILEAFWLMVTCSFQKRVHCELEFRLCSHEWLFVLMYSHSNPNQWLKGLA